MRHPLPFALTALAALVATGCSSVRYSRVADDWKPAGRERVKRLTVVTHPLPEGRPELGELWGLIARRYVNQNRDFLVKSHQALPEPPAGPGLAALCQEEVEGVLWLEPHTRRKPGGVEAQVEGRLLRCPDGREEWAAAAGGSWKSDDGKFKARIADYTRELGPEVAPYVAPAFRVLQATLDTLPNPTLNDQDIEEKIELGE
jgi:probable lipoprotein (TIGR04455 family)